MNTFRAAVCAFLFAGTAFARPVVLEEVAVLSPPDSSWQRLGVRGVAIDGDFALAFASRTVPDPYSESGSRIELGAFVYQRSGTRWNYSRQLGPLGVLGDLSTPGLAMKGGIAVVDTGSGTHLFERSGTAWTEAALPPGTHLGGTDIKIDSGRILVSTSECNPTAAVLRKIDGQWTIEGELEGYSRNCDYGPSNNHQDIEGEFAAVHDPVEGTQYPPPNPRVRLYRRNQSGGGWGEFANISGSNTGIWQPDVAMAGPYLAYTGSRVYGTSVAFSTEEFGPFSAMGEGLQAPDAYLAPEAWSATGIEGVGNLIAQRNYSFDRKAYVYNLFRISEDQRRTNTLVATLQTKNGWSLGELLDSSGNYVIVNEPFTSGTPQSKVRIYQLPASYEQPSIQVHDFESPSAGAAWQPTAGSSFSTVVSRGTHVYRQASTTGNPSSSLPTSTATNQAIQSDLIITSFGGSGALAGLMTRRSSDADYYYVALRNTGVIELGRKVSGTFAVLATAPATVVTGRMYRLRLESMATTHRVYLDDSLVITARDSALKQGDAGVITNRAAADYDNVIVTPSSLTSIYRTKFSAPETNDWVTRWQTVDGVFRQPYTTGYARAVIGVRIDDCIVQARIRPTSFVGPDDWVGLMARYQDDRNYLFVSLRNRGVISLWRRTDGTNTQLAARRLPVSAGTWYRVRMEVVNGITRVIVDNKVLLSTSADPGPTIEGNSDSKGKVGLITYKASADFDDFVSYQP